jgi:hypothetical protein
MRHRRAIESRVIQARAYGGKGTKPFDKVVLALFAVFMLAVPVVAGLDAVRFGWSRPSFGWLWAAWRSTRSAPGRSSGPWSPTLTWSRRSA